ncbi:MAG: amino acid ABC transporter ATP-binding protein [Rhodoglobus sp.]
MTNQVPVLSVDNLEKSFGDTKIIKGVSLEILAGKTVALIGASGSGKSTLLRCMGLLEPFEAGTVSLRGEVIARGGSKARRETKADARKRANFGFVFQQFNLIQNRTALENVMEGPVVVQGKSTSEARTIALDLMDRVGVSHRINAAVPEMSGGEQQRVAIARAMAMSPQCLLLDEPTSALDPELVSEVLDVVGQLSRDGVTMVIVTHEMGFAYEAADHVVYLNQGTICEEGPAKEIFDAPESRELKSFLRRFHYSSLPNIPPITEGITTVDANALPSTNSR